MEQSKEYTELYEQYQNKSNEELQSIISSGDDYRELAKKVAADVLSSDRSKYNSTLMEQQKDEEEAAYEMERTINHPLYEDIHQIASDIRFMKNLIIVGLVISIAFGLISAILVSAL